MIEKVYVFLTNLIGGTSGGVRYVSNKTEWLEKKGWNVVAFDTTGQNNPRLVVENLKIFSNNRMRELFYFPGWFTEKKRKSILQKIRKAIPSAVQIVIESNTSSTAQWGELLAAELKAKHVVFLIGEHIRVSNPKEFEFLYYKATQSELFTIKPQAYELLFSNFIKVSDADSHFWYANTKVPIKEIPCKGLSNMKMADIIIGHFGRKKEYFPYMLSEIEKFAELNPSVKINMVFLGCNKTKVHKRTNLNCYFIPSQVYLPKLFFDICDVIIATAGCAAIARDNGNLVISMDVINQKPLGVLGYTTNDNTFSSSDNNIEKKLSEIVDDCVIKKKFKNKLLVPSLNKMAEKGYDYQLACVLKPKTESYSHVLLSAGNISRHDGLLKLMLRLGFIRLASVIRYIHFYLSI